MEEEEEEALRNRRSIETLKQARKKTQKKTREGRRSKEGETGRAHGDTFNPVSSAESQSAAQMMADETPLANSSGMMDSMSRLHLANEVLSAAANSNDIDEIRLAIQTHAEHADPDVLQTARKHRDKLRQQAKKQRRHLERATEVLRVLRESTAEEGGGGTTQLQMVIDEAAKYTDVIPELDAEVTAIRETLQQREHAQSRLGGTMVSTTVALSSNERLVHERDSLPNQLAKGWSVAGQAKTDSGSKASAEHRGSELCVVCLDASQASFRVFKC